MTIYDIANLAGVSIATVSRVMQGKSNVSEATREKVLSVMKAHNYSPSMIARGMSSKSLQTIAIVIQDFSNYHHMKIAHEIEKYFNSISFNVVIYEAGVSDKDVCKFLERMKEFSIDGFVLVGSVFQLIEGIQEEALRLIGDKPIVIVNGWFPGTYGLLVDEADGEELASDYLFEKGASKIIFVRHNTTNSSFNKEHGFRRSAAKNGFEASFVIMDGKDDYLGLKTGIMKENIVPGHTAIVTVDDRIGLMASNICRELGYEVPRDIQIIGYDNSEYATLSSPTLTTVDNFAHTQGQECAAFLGGILNGNTEEKKVFSYITPELVFRGSSF